MDNITIISLTTKSDPRGNLVFAEVFKEIPFEIKRIYYIYGVPSKKIIRGLHAHKSLKQVIFCVGGECEIEFDDGTNKETVTLDTPNKAIIVYPVIWREIKKVSKNATIVVLASEPYNELDYIRSYDEFRQYMMRHKDE